MVCRLEERTIFWKKKKILSAARELERKKGYLDTHKRVKYFLWYFLNATSFTPNFWGGFRALKSMSRDHLRRNLVQPNILLF